MKKIFWTTVFRLVVFFGFVFYIKMFDANMAAGLSARFNPTATITASGEVIAAPGSDVMSGINAIQTTLTDMQTKLDTLVGGTTTTTTTTPVVAPTPVVDTASTGSTK